MRYKTTPQQAGQPDHAGIGIAKFLGVFSVVIGLVELIWSAPVAHALGLQGYEHLVQIYGARELLTGIMIFAFKDPLIWIWFRVVGDVLDVVTVIFGYNRHLAPDISFIITAVLLLVAGGLDLYCAIRLSRDSKFPQQAGMERMAR